jgi:hypothetical protein
MIEPQAMTSENFRTWKFSQERADKIKDALWSRMTWVLAIYGAIFAFLTNEKIQIVTFPVGSFFEVSKPESAVGIGWLGVLLSVSTILMFYDGMKHIQFNWDRSTTVAGDTPETGLWKKYVRARVPLYLVLCVNIIALVGFVVLIMFA